MYVIVLVDWLEEEEDDDGWEHSATEEWQPGAG